MFLSFNRGQATSDLRSGSTVERASQWPQLTRAFNLTSPIICFLNLHYFAADLITVVYGLWCYLEQRFHPYSVAMTLG